MIIGIFITLVKTYLFIFVSITTRWTIPMDWTKLTIVLSIHIIHIFISEKKIKLLYMILTFIFNQ